MTQGRVYNYKQGNGTFSQSNQFLIVQSLMIQWVNGFCTFLLFPCAAAFGLLLSGEETWPQGMGRTGGENVETGEDRVGKKLFLVKLILAFFKKEE